MQTYGLEISKDYLYFIYVLHIILLIEKTLKRFDK